MRRTRSAEDLLWFLHAHPEGRARPEILTERWNPADMPAGADRCRIALHRLRAALGKLNPHPARRRIEAFYSEP